MFVDMQSAFDGVGTVYLDREELTRSPASDVGHAHR